MSIPKIIHYCWFGGNPLNELAERCINSWKKYCPEYEIKLWNEQNFNVNINIFAKEAYDEKKWAFVSDYARLYVLYEYGGVYMDADVELLQNIDPILNGRSAVTGYQDDVTIPAALMAAEQKNIWIKQMLDYYDGRHFKQTDGTLDMRTNSEIITILSHKESGFRLGDSFIENGKVVLLPCLYLAPYAKTIFKKANYNINDIYKIDKKLTFAVHHGAGSWESNTKITYIKKLLLGIVRIVLTERFYRIIKSKILRKKWGLN